VAAVDHALPLPERSDEPVAHALPAAAAARGLDARSLERRAGLLLGTVQQILDGLVPDPSDAVLDALARALGVEPSYFLEYRLRSVLEALEEEVERLDALFLELLTPLEVASLAADDLSDLPLGEAVVELRAEQGLTQGELADSVGFSQGHVSRRLRERFPSPDFLEMVALALATDPCHFREYRGWLVGVELERRPSLLNALFDELGDPLRLTAYDEWSARPLDVPERLSPLELLTVIREVVATEGPVRARRVYRLVVRAAGCELTRDRRSLLDKASSALECARVVVSENELNGPTLVDRILRLPGTTRVIPRRRGPRELNEVPLSELEHVAGALAATRRLRAVDELQDDLARLYEIRHPTLREREHLNRAITRILRPT
jgi:transcriptional regulator with XRE-family HTH domain